MAWYKKISIPFKLYDQYTGTMADWTVIFRNEMSGGSADVTLQSAAKLKKLGEFNMEFNITDNEFIMPNFDMVMIDPYRDGNNTSLFDFICSPLNYGIKTRVQVYIYKGAVLTYKFFTDRTKLNFNDKTYELKIRGIVEHVSPSAIVFRDENGVAKNPLLITESGGAYLRFYSLLIYIANGMGLSLESSRPRGYLGVNYKFGNWYRWNSALSSNKPTDDSDLNLFDSTMYVSTTLYSTIMKGFAQSGYKSLKDVLRLLGDGLQITLGADEYGFLCIKPRVRFTGFISIPDSEVMNVEFEEWQEYIGAHIEAVNSVYVNGIKESAGVVIKDDEGNIVNSEQVYSINRDYPNDSFSMCSRFSVYDANVDQPLQTNRYVPSSGSDQDCHFVDHKIPKPSGDEIYSGSLKFAVAILYNLIKMTKGRVAVKVRGTARKIYEDYSVNFYYANGSSVTLNIAVDKISKNLEENYTTIRGFVVGDAPFVEKYPSNQPTNLTFTNLGPNSLTINWDRAASVVTGYVAFSKEGSAVTFVPVDGVTYSVGTTYGDGKCTASGDVITANLSSLTANTAINIAVWSYNDVGGVKYYYPGLPLTGVKSTLQSEPAAQPSTFIVVYQSETAITLRATPSVTSPLADFYSILAKIDAYSGEAPSDGISYIVGDEINDAKVVFVGAGTGTSPRDFAITGLIPEKEYYFEIFAARGTGESINYKTGSPLQGIARTFAEILGTAVVDINFTNILSSSIKAVCSTNGYADGCTVVYNTVSPTAVPVDGNAYTDFAVIGGGTDKSFTLDFSVSLQKQVTGLTGSTVYKFKIYPFKGVIAGSRNYQTSPAPSDVTQATAGIATPANQPLNFNIHQLVSEEFIFTAENNSPEFDSIVIYRKGFTATTLTPTDGTDPTVNTTGTTSDVCIYDGPPGVDIVTRPANAATRYYARVFASNGTGAARKYNLISPPTDDLLEGLE